MPAPSPHTKPSRSASNGRDAVAGSSLRVDIAFIAQNPPMASGDDDRLGAARDHDVGVAALDDADGVADRVVAGGARGHDDEFGPLAPKRIETRPEAMLTISIGMKNGETRSGPFSSRISVRTRGAS